MTASFARSPALHRAWARGSLAVVAAAALVVLGGCSSKPGYCDKRTDLQNSVKGLADVNLSNGVSGLKAKLTNIQSSASALVDSAKSDFPNETSAISSSVDTLKTALQSLSSSPSAADLATITTDARNVVTSVNNFASATKSKCE